MRALSRIALPALCGAGALLLGADAPGGRPVPPPWTPVAVAGESVRCWGRDHLLSGALPRQIVSRGQPLLAGSIALRFAGEPGLDWKRGAFSRDARAATWRATAPRGGAVVRARTRVEYDGFWEVEVDLGAGSVRGLHLEIPLAARHARYLHFVNETHYQEQNSLRLPARKGELWSNRFACMVWIGDERVGLAWCADTDAPFRLRQPERALTIRRAGRAVTLRVHLIDHPVTLTRPLRWRFGLIATPVRPMPARWRDWRLAPGESANLQILWWNAWTGSHADLTPKDPAALRKQVSDARIRGQELLPYTALQALSERSAAYREGRSRWRREPFSKLEDEGTPYWIVCPNTPWRSFFPRQAERLSREYGVGGIYCDFTFPYHCEAAHHPCGQVDAGGKRRGEFRVFALRKMAQETYERVKAVGADRKIMLHTSGALMYPYIGFADLMLNGEQLRQPLMKAGGRTIDVLPLESLRAEYRGEHAGLAPFLIPQLATPEGMPDPHLTRIPGPTNEILALTLLHDIGVWPIYCHLESVEAARVAQRDFGITDARFIPYWEGGGPIVVSHPRVLTSVWVRPGALLTVTANLGSTPAQTRVRLRKRPGRDRIREAKDALTGEALALDGGSVSVRIPGRSFRLIRLQLGTATGAAASGR